MRLIISLLMVMVLFSSCKREEKVIEDAEKNLKEDFGPSPVDG